MAVPKCKKCKCAWNIPVADYSSRMEYYCHWWRMDDFKGNGGKIDIIKTGCVGTDGKRIASKDYRTSPKWCPLREEG